MWGERDYVTVMSIDHNSCAVTTTIGSAEGLAQIHSHPLSYEAAFNLRSFLVREKGDVSFFLFALLRSNKRPQNLYSYTHL